MKFSLLQLRYPGNLTGAQSAPILSATMAHSVAIILCLLVLQVLPSLCAAGVIAHACGCADVMGCESACECETDAACHHEANCAEGPCSTLVTRPEREEPHLTTLAEAPVSIAHCSSEATVSRALIYACSWTESPPCGNLPYPPSDLPLLL